MKTWALAAAGAISRSFLGRVPGLSRQLGPVASTSYRLASRIANSLRAGTAVRSAAELQESAIVLICVPGGSPARLVDAAFLRALDWTQKVVLACDCQDDPESASALREHGAAVGSLTSLAGLPDRFIVEGDSAAVRLGKLIVQSLRAHAIEIPRQHLLLFQSALTLSGSLFTPLLEVAIECLRQSGLEQPQASKLAESLFEHSLRGYTRAGRKSWSGPIALADNHAVEAQQQALRAVKPLMADYFRDAARFSFDLYQTFPELTRYNKPRWKAFGKRYKTQSSA